jgi:hypothetical protein
MVAGNRDLAPTWVAGAGFGVLTVNSALAIYRARDDAAAVAFVAGSYLTLLLLFGALRKYERAPPGSPGTGRSAAWPLTTVPNLSAAVMPSVVVAGGGHRGMDRKVAALTMASLGVMTCDTALAIHQTRGGDMVSATFVLAAYAALLALIYLFIREFAAGRARGAGNGVGVGAVDVAY